MFGKKKKKKSGENTTIITLFWTFNFILREEGIRVGCFDRKFLEPTSVTKFKLNLGCVCDGVTY